MCNNLKLAYDADCGFCQVTADVFAGLQFYKGTVLELVAYQDPNLLEHLPGIDVSHADGGVQLLLEDGRVFCDAAAVGEILKRTCWWWWLGWMIRLPIAKHAAQIGYRMIAVNRRRMSLWLGLKACRLPSATKNSLPGK